MQADSVYAAIRDVEVEHLLASISVIAALVVPVIGLWFLRPRNTPRGEAGIGLRRASAYVGLGLFAWAAFLFGVCSGGEIGEPGKVRLVRAMGAPIIAALSDYRRTHGRYPPQLDDLVPSYVTSSLLQAPDSSVLKHSFEYRADSSSFELSVSFAGPGMNTCRYRPDTKWHCSGLF